MRVNVTDVWEIHNEREGTPSMGLVTYNYKINKDTWVKQKLVQYINKPKVHYERMSMSSYIRSFTTGIDEFVFSPIQKNKR